MPTDVTVTESASSPDVHASSGMGAGPTVGAGVE